MKGAGRNVATTGNMVATNTLQEEPGKVIMRVETRLVQRTVKRIDDFTTIKETTE